MRLECQSLSPPTAARPSTHVAPLPPKNPDNLPSPVLSSEGYSAWRSLLSKTLALPVSLPGLQAEAQGSYSPAQGVRAERIHYNVGHGRQISAVLYLPESTAEPVPAIVLVNDVKDSNSIWYDAYAGVLYARTGAAVLTYDPVGAEVGAEATLARHLDRANLQAASYAAAPATQQIDALPVLAVLQAAQYLRQRQEVDPHRISIIGYGSGSLPGLLASAVDPRIYAMVLAGGGDFDGPGGYWESADPLMQAQDYAALRRLGGPYADRTAMLYALHARSGPTLVINGSKDTVNNLADRGRAFFTNLWQQVGLINGQPTQAQDVIFLYGDGHGPGFLSKASLLWLNHQLRLTHWTDTEIQALPLVPANEWIAAHRLSTGHRKQRLRDDNAMQIPSIGAAPLASDNNAVPMLEAHQ
jgi:dienelactone hydrolase